MAELVTVILPALNAESTISRAIDSLLDQVHQEWELIIADNNSTDSTASIAASYKDSRIRIISAKEQGVSNARNTALDLAKGDFICFLDADDVLTPHSLSARIVLFNDPKTVVDGAVDFVDTPRGIWKPIGSKDLMKSLVHLEDHCFCGVTWMYRFDHFSDVRFHPDLSHSEDLYFCMQLAANGAEYHFTNAVTYQKYQTPGSAMSNLQGLSNGYSKVYDLLSRWHIPADWKEAYRKQARAVMIKSYLKSGHYFEGVRSIFRYLKS